MLQSWFAARQCTSSGAVHIVPLYRASDLVKLNLQPEEAEDEKKEEEYDTSRTPYVVTLLPINRCQPFPGHSFQFVDLCQLLIASSFMSEQDHLVF